MVAQDSLALDWILGVSRNAIRANELSAAMVDIALNGIEVDTAGNTALRDKGRKLLARKVK